ncbi:hypothetical protein [Bifidobacterium ramosum]|nr:hypothetical protein [Bifidobacterium ramosum]NEG72071.1 hypothetical protein [Bifidobacterium ramosum]
MSKHPKLTAAVSALIPILLICILSKPHFATSDDYSHSYFAIGSLYNTRSYLDVYSLILISAPLALLYSIVDSIPWYSLLLFAGIWGFTAIAYWHIRHTLIPSYIRFLSFASILTIEISSTLYLTYSIVAFLFCAAGFMLIIPVAAFRNVPKIRFADVIGILLLALGFSLRPESGAGTFLMFLPFALWVLCINRHISSILRMVASILAVVFAWISGQFAYTHTEGWKDFTAYLNPGRTVTDSPHVDASVIQQVVPEFSENDVSMMYHWLFADQDVFSIDRFNRAASAIPAYSLHNIFLSGKAGIIFSFICILLVLLWAVMIVRSQSIVQNNYSWLLPTGIAIITIVEYAILLLHARPRTYVVLPILFTAITAMICTERLISTSELQNSISKPTKRVGKHAMTRMRTKQILIMLLTTVICLMFCSYVELTSVRTTKSYVGLKTPISRYFEYAKNHTNMIVIPSSDLVNYAYENVFTYSDIDIPSNVALPGGWRVATSVGDNFYSINGLEKGNLFIQSFKHKRLVFAGSKDTAEIVRTYLIEHTGKSVKLMKIENLGTAWGTDNYLYRLA